MTNLAERIEQSGALNPPADLRLIETEAVETNGLRLEGEMLFWETIKDSTNAEDYEAYLETFPEGIFAPLARRRAMRKSAVAEVVELTQTPDDRPSGLDFDQLSESAKENTERAKRKAANPPH